MQLIAEDIKRTWDRGEAEDPESWAAFVIYKDLGYERSIKLLQVVLADKNYSDDLLKSWMKDYNWVSRARDFDNYANQKTEQLIIKSSVKRRIKIETVMNHLVDKYIAKILTGDIKIDFTFDNFLKLVKLSTDFDAVTIDTIIKAADLNENDMYQSSAAEIEQAVEVESNLTPEERDEEKKSALREKLRKKYGGRAGHVFLNKKKSEENGNT